MNQVEFVFVAVTIVLLAQLQVLIVLLVDLVIMSQVELVFLVLITVSLVILLLLLMPYVILVEKDLFTALSVNLVSSVLLVALFVTLKVFMSV